MIPLHVAPIGTVLDANYFSPGVTMIRDKIIGSPWVLAYFRGNEYRYERAAVGAVWIRVK